MKKALLIALFLAGPALGSGSRNSYADPKLNDEFDNVYFQIGSVLKGPLRISSMTVTSLNVSTISVVGVTDGTDACTGCVGEYVEAVSSSDENFPATGVFGDLVSIDLTAGDWDIFGSLYVDHNSATWTNFEIYISTTAGNDSTELTRAVNNSFVSIGSNSTVGDFTLNIGRLRASLTGSKTYYLKRKSSYSVGTPISRGAIISARRVR